MLIERYIEETYQLYQLSGRVYPPYFQVHFISVNINAVALSITQSSHINYFRRERRQKTQTKKNLQEKQHSQYKKNPCQIGQIGQMIKLSCEYLSVRWIWLYVLVMSRARFRVNPQSIVAWMSRNFLLETGANSEV